MRSSSSPSRKRGPEDDEILGHDGDVAEQGTSTVAPKPATEFFQAQSYRPGQREAIEHIDHAYEQGYRYVLLEAPTGIGKSHIAAAFAEQCQSCNIVTPQKILQDQYQRDFPRMFVMKGKAAYTCIAAKTKCSCEEGPCNTNKTLLRGVDCPYRQALRASMRAPVVLHNFDSFYYQSRFIPDFPFRDLTVIDECHNTEGKFLDFMGFTVSNRQHADRAITPVIPYHEQIDQYDDFLIERMHLADQEATSIQDSESDDPRQIKRMREMMSLAEKIDHYFMSREQGIEYIAQYEDQLNFQQVRFQPVMVGDFVTEFLTRRSSRVLMMSATILDKNIFCDSVGIDPDDAFMIRMDSIFAAKNRPIRLRFAGSMNYANKSSTMPMLYEKIKEILAAHPMRRGIIHTHTEEIVWRIRENVRDPRLTFHKDYRTLEEMLEAHMAKENSFIVASGLREGIDLKDAMSRVQVMCKIPYPSLGDKRVARRKELDKQWYGYMTTLLFVQTLGRSVRNMQDRAITYILDEDFRKFYFANKDFIPPYIRKAIQWPPKKKKASGSGSKTKTA